MTNLFDINGKVALITGSTHGLGMAMAKGLGQAGATIIVNGNSSQEKIDIAVNELKSEGINAVGYKFNVTEEKEVAEAVKKLKAKLVQSLF
jgi:gluconate 5-dehydrogenase